jgi:hypothetical protein
VIRLEVVLAAMTATFGIAAFVLGRRRAVTGDSVVAIAFALSAGLCAATLVLLLLAP